MTIAQALKLATAELSSAKISLPRLEAEILLSGILKKPREFLLTRPEHELKPSEISDLRQQIRRRLKGEPVAYLTGRKEFYGLNFRVNKNVLIPRPETELMIEEAIKLIARNSQPITLADIGTGSGCIIITLAKLLNQELSNINHEFIATDLSAKALTVAKQNARAHQVNKKIRFLRGNLLTPLIHHSSFMIHNSLIILANLPYGWRAWKNNCSLDTAGLKFEPSVALFTDKHGLKLYEQLFKQIKELRVASCELRDLRVLCEFDPRQTTKIKQLVKRKLPGALCQIKKDLAGLNRLAIITIPVKQGKRRR